MEFLDRRCINVVEDHAQLGLDREAGALLMFGDDGAPGTADESIARGEVTGPFSNAVAAIRALRTAKALHAFEVKRSSVFRESDLDGLRLFCADYPSAAGHLFYGGTKRYRFDAIDVVPIAEGLSTLREVLGGVTAL